MTQAPRNGFRRGEEENSLAKIKDTEYLFLSAYIRARENSLLGARRLEQMVDAADFDEAARVLTECGFPDLSGAGDRQLEEAFSARREQYLSEMEKLCPEKGIVTAFRLKYDYHNAKVLVKGEGGPKDNARLLSGCGRVPAQVLSDAFYEDAWQDVPGDLAAAIRQARATLARTSNPQLADMDLDRAYFAQLLAETESLSSGFYAGYVRLSIDVANLRSAVRCVRGHMDEGVLRAALIDGGNVSTESVRRVYGEPVTEVFRDRVLEKCAQLGQQAAEGAPLAAFERECDNVLTAYLTGAKRVSFGPETAVAYLASLEAEITAARMVLLGKRSGLSPEALRERLRDSYV